LTPLADAAAVVLAAGTLSSLVTTPLWLRSRHHAAVLGREAARNAAENLDRAAETRHLIEVRVPAVLARLTFPHLPVPGPLHPRFAGSALEADHVALLDQIAAVAARSQPRADEPATAADWFEPRHKAPGAARTGPYLDQPEPGAAPDRATTRPPGRHVGPRPGPASQPAPHPVLADDQPAPAEQDPAAPPAPPASGLRGSSAVWSAFQSGTESGRAAAEHRFADTYHADSHHEGSL
jgi:hypothetical protein